MARWVGGVDKHNRERGRTPLRLGAGGAGVCAGAGLVGEVWLFDVEQRMDGYDRAPAAYIA